MTRRRATRGRAGPDRGAERPRIRRDLFAFAPGPDEIQIQAGELTGPVFHVRDDEESGRLARFLSWLDGSRTQAQILRSLPAADRVAFRELVEHLRESDLLEPRAPGAGAATLRASAPGPLVGALTAEEREADTRALRAAKVFLVGRGRLARLVAEGLCRLGVGSLRLWDPPAPSATNGHGPRSRVRDRDPGWAAELERTFPATRVRAVPVGLEGLGERLAGSTLVVVAVDAASPAVFETVNAAALAHRVPWTLAYVDGLDAFAGPTVLPFETACYTCLRMRLRGHVQARDYHERYWAHLHRDGRGLPAARTPPPGAAELVAGLVLLDVPSVVAHRTGVTPGQVVSVNLQSLALEVESVLRLPRCPSCGKLARGHPIRQTHATNGAILALLGGRGPPRAPQAEG